MNRVQEVPICPRPLKVFDGILGAGAIEDIITVASDLRTALSGRTIWNINSTASGGGVAEMLHSLLSYARGLGVDTRWLVVQGTPDFFSVTKRLHNALHGERGDGSDLGDPQRCIYERVIEANAREILSSVRPHDVVILHDPQTVGLSRRLARHQASVIWRCHVGDDRPSREAARGWRFLAPYLEHVRSFVFSRAAYVPSECDHGRSVVVPPSIDPFSAKNMEIDDTMVRAILARTGLVSAPGGRAAPTFTRSDGSRSRVTRKADMMREGPPPGWDDPLVVQVSRWDRLKDPVGVLQGFSRLGNGTAPAGAHLVLAGPNVHGVSDDPEGGRVFDRVVEGWKALPESRRRRVHLANLPMEDLQENALIVNALQRHAAVVVQKSLREGFGLTVTEAMWKARPVVASAVGGLKDQVRHEATGLLLEDPGDLDQFASYLRLLLEDEPLRERLGRNARAHVTENFLGLRALVQYAELIRTLAQG
ncbi:MAG: glycosyltransferase [Acidobacteriota bacterium]